MNTVGHDAGLRKTRLHDDILKMCDERARPSINLNMNQNNLIR